MFTRFCIRTIQNMTSIDHSSKSRYGVVYPGVCVARPVFTCPAYSDLNAL